MNNAQVQGLVRAVMLGLGGVLVTLGVQVASGPGWEALTGIAVSFAGMAWSWYSNKTTSMISQVVKDDDVHVVVTTQKIADADPSPKVTDPQSIVNEAARQGVHP